MNTENERIVVQQTESLSASANVRVIAHAWDLPFHLRTLLVYVHVLC